MTTAVRESKRSIERRRLLVFRYRGLLDLGFAAESAFRLADHNDVVHEAQALLERGWPHEFVVDELANWKDRP